MKHGAVDVVAAQRARGGERLCAAVRLESIDLDPLVADLFGDGPSLIKCGHSAGVSVRSSYRGVCYAPLRSTQNGQGRGEPCDSD